MNARPESYGKVLLSLGGLFAALLAVGLSLLFQQPEPEPELPVKGETTKPAPLSHARPKPAPAVAAADPDPAPPLAPEPPAIDHQAVAKAQAELDLAAKDRALAEARAQAEACRLAAASVQAAADRRASQTLAFRVKDPTVRLNQAAAKAAAMKAAADAVKAEADAIAARPRPSPHVLANQNPVAKPADGDEHHFEIRHGRVTYIDLDRLMTLVKADAQLRIRLSDGGRLVDSKVGPVGAFSLQYVLARTLPAGLEELMAQRGVSYDLRGWEVIPQFEGRGESYEQTRPAFSEYARTISRLSPSHASVTFWVYPDSFDLFRKLREELQSRGFLVSGRPLPEGMAIRGSPAGSLSAGQ